LNYFYNYINNCYLKRCYYLSFIFIFSWWLLITVFHLYFHNDHWVLYILFIEIIEFYMYFHKNHWILYVFSQRLLGFICALMKAFRLCVCCSECCQGFIYESEECRQGFMYAVSSAIRALYMDLKSAVGGSCMLSRVSSGLYIWRP
jgi:hypothetical protein